MYFSWLFEVIKRALIPAPRLTDTLQILAASALPALSQFAGLSLPAGAPQSVLAYIGLIALCFLAIRFLWAPYAIWREKEATITSLNAELAKPERMIFAEIAKHRAEARAQLTVALEDFQTVSFTVEPNDIYEKMFVERHNKIKTLAATAGLSQSYDQTWRLFRHAVKQEAETPNEHQGIPRVSTLILPLLQKHVIEDLSADDLEQEIAKLGAD
jgi:hypothetical protein